MTMRTAASEESAFPPYRLARVDELVLYKNNPRTHAPAQIERLAASIREFGFTNAILTDGANGVVAGHGRLLAARKLGLATVPTLELSHLSAAQRRAYIIADNKLALDAGWDDDLLRLELGALRDDGFALDLTGFNALELADLLADRTDGLTDPDDVPEVPEVAVTQPGDVWLLGRHRLCCGDATKDSHVSLALAGVRPHLMVTDPPYGVDYDPDWRNRADRANGKPYGGRAIGVVTNDDRADWSEAWALFPGDVAYVWCAPGPLNCSVHDSLRDSGLEPRMQIVWAKNHFVIGRGNYHAQHENCWYAVRKSGTAHWSGDRTQSTVWQIDKPHKSETGHSTQKPVECMKRPIENNSSPGQAVYDPFVGSFTTGIACEMTGRSLHALEINPLYVDCGIRRWQNFTGQEAVLLKTAETFAVVEARRGQASEQPSDHADAR